MVQSASLKLISLHSALVSSLYLLGSSHAINRAIQITCLPLPDHAGRVIIPTRLFQTQVRHRPRLRTY
ncbi:hypothetical protein CA234_11175 [Sphingomonas sp. ABOLE]|nr:hypothetical protein CA234_11175 [Sphingomonas sp. ABOLE]